MGLHFQYSYSLNLNGVAHFLDFGVRKVWKIGILCLKNIGKICSKKMVRVKCPTFS